MKQLPEKLDPLIRRLSTDNDGETVACVRAISRVLASAGMSFHDLADRLKGAPAAGPRFDPFAYAKATQEASAARARQQREREAAHVVGEFKTWLEAVEWLQGMHGAALREREQAFVASLVENLPRYNKPTEKQEKWLRDILARFGVS